MTKLYFFKKKKVNFANNRYLKVLNETTIHRVMTFHKKKKGQLKINKNTAKHYVIKITRIKELFR